MPAGGGVLEPEPPPQARARARAALAKHRRREAGTDRIIRGSWDSRKMAGRKAMRRDRRAMGPLITNIGEWPSLRPDCGPPQAHLQREVRNRRTRSPPSAHPARRPMGPGTANRLWMVFPAVPGRIAGAVQAAPSHREKPTPSWTPPTPRWIHNKAGRPAASRVPTMTSVVVGSGRSVRGVPGAAPDRGASHRPSDPSPASQPVSPAARKATRLLAGRGRLTLSPTVQTPEAARLRGQAWRWA